MKTAIMDMTKNENGCEMRYILFEIREGGKTDYGFAVELHSDERDDYEYVCDICDTRKEAEILFNKMYAGTVTPDSLFYIAEDYVTEKSFAG